MSFQRANSQTEQRPAFFKPGHSPGITPIAPVPGQGVD